MYDYDLNIQNIDAFKNAFVEAMTQEQPDLDKMSNAFEAIVSAYDDLSQQATASDMVRANAKERIFKLNEMLNSRMNEIINNQAEEKEESKGPSNNELLGSFFGFSD